MGCGAPLMLLAVGLVLVAIVTTAYVWDLRVHPYGRCRACKGSGRNRGSTAKRYGICRRCTNGRRVRAGARVVRPGLRKGK